MGGVRTGIGWDSHRLIGGPPTRRLILGGIEIPYDRGLLGHSDADVLTHAVIDALLGAAGLDVDLARVNVKASTGEGLGFVGRGEGVAALAVATLTAP